MFNNNSQINESGVKILSPEAQNNTKLMSEYKKIQDAVKLDERYVDFPSQEDFDYLCKVEETYFQKHPEDLELFEDSGGWWGISPFEWTKGVNLGGIGKIFAPVKWLAGILFVGLGILLAGIIKALKEGKKQVAIARVKKWIERLVVIADGGYKKSKKSKDSLFLIEARARRDILQAAVMAGHAAGIDIPEKSNEPVHAESAKNESLELVGMDGFLNEDSPLLPGSDFMNNTSTPTGNAQTQQTNLTPNVKTQDTFRYNGQEYVDWDKVQQAIAADVQSGRLPNKESAKTEICYEGKSEFIPITSGNQPNNANQGMDAVINGETTTDSSTNTPIEQKKNIPGLDLDLNEIEKFIVQNQEGKVGGEYNNNDEGIKKLIADLETATFGKSIQGQNMSAQGVKKIDGTFSLMSIYIKQRGVEKTIGPLSPEQKVFIIQQIQNYYNKISQEVKAKLNQSYDINTLLPDDSQVDWSLMKTIKSSSWFGLVKHKTDLWAEAKSVHTINIKDVVEESQRQQYITNILTNVNAALTKITTPAIAKNYTNVINQFNQSLLQRDQSKNSKIPASGGSANVGMRVGNHGVNESIDTSKYPIFADDVKMFEAGNFTRDDFKNMLFPEEKQQNYEIDYDKERSLVDNTFKASQNIFTSASLSEFLIFTKTRDQMNNFLNELSKTVHLIIDSVAKKAKENNYQGNSATNAIIHFLSSDSGDPKQNRTLTALWDGYARPQLDSRAITRLFEIVSCPEFVYFIQMLTKTIPMCIMTLYLENTDPANKCVGMLTKDGRTLTPQEILDNETKKALAKMKKEPVKNIKKENLIDTATGTSSAKEDEKNQDAATTQNTPQQPQNSSVQYTMNDFLNE